MTNTSPAAFATIPIPERPMKPRNSGLTITVEFGLGLAAQRDLLEIASPSMDYAKLVVSLARLVPLGLLRQKNDLYRDFGVEPYPGGMFLWGSPVSVEA